MVSPRHTRFEVRELLGYGGASGDEVPFIFRKKKVLLLLLLLPLTVHNEQTHQPSQTVGKAGTGKKENKNSFEIKMLEKKKAFRARGTTTVSYTHLTLPTILRV